MELTGKKVLVTGGTGMIGQAVIRHLDQAGAHVATLSRRGARATNPEHEARIGDVTDPTTLDFAGFDAVVHGAAWVGFGLDAKKQEILMNTNVQGTQNVLDAAADAGVEKVLHISSVAALGATHGEPRGEQWFHERPHVFQSTYERSKFEAHGILLAEQRVETAAILPSVVLGLGDSSSGLILRAYLKGRFPATPKHPGRIGWVHVEDVASAAVLALEKGSGPYVVNEADLTIPDLFTIFEETTGVKRPRPTVPFWVIRAVAGVLDPVYKAFGRRAPLGKDMVRSLARDSQFDATRARTELGWVPDMRRHLKADAEQVKAQR